eukprot:6487365-Amphidinium_carterae.2
MMLALAREDAVLEDGDDSQSKLAVKVRCHPAQQSGLPNQLDESAWGIVTNITSMFELARRSGEKLKDSFGIGKFDKVEGIHNELNNPIKKHQHGCVDMLTTLEWAHWGKSRVIAPWQLLQYCRHDAIRADGFHFHFLHHIYL